MREQEHYPADAKELGAVQEAAPEQLARKARSGPTAKHATRAQDGSTCAGGGGQGLQGTTEVARQGTSPDVTNEPKDF